ncbi:hypothetical protein B0A63_08550 [Flavobacterium johnsoniae UW101]|nr:hypothetical protein B0A63_08550 [Flavobacterium johnsoniae UW101]
MKAIGSLPESQPFSSRNTSVASKTDVEIKSAINSAAVPLALPGKASERWDIRRLLDWELRPL